MIITNTPVLFLAVGWIKMLVLLALVLELDLESIVLLLSPLLVDQEIILIEPNLAPEQASH